MKNSGRKLYDPAKHTFSISGALAEERYRHATTLLPNGKVLVAGGLIGNIDTASAEIYDPGNGRFASAGAMIIPREYHTATLLPNGMVLIVGGTNQDFTASSSGELYN